jgi:hypothetical protein
MHEASQRGMTFEQWLESLVERDIADLTGGWNPKRRPPPDGSHDDLP